MTTCPVKISTMTGKLQGLFAINFNPLTTDFCNASSRIQGSVCAACYSRKMMQTSRINCNKAWTANARIMSTELLDQVLPRFPIDACVRFLAHGELDNIIQLVNFINIARVNPLTHFALWTKRTDLVHELSRFYKKPENLTMIQSSLMLNTQAVAGAFFDATFTVYTKEHAIPEDTHLCSGQKCIECAYCYSDGNIPNNISERLK